METQGHSKADTQLPAIQPGFSVVSTGGSDCIILCKRGGMGCMNFFLIFWLSGWSVGCVSLLQAYFHGGKMDDGQPIPLWFVSIFWAAEVIVACLLVYMLFARKSFHLNATCLVTETNVLGLRWRKTIPKTAIQRFVQVKDGGEGDDSFPSWGLKVEADTNTTLLFRQPYEKSHWLGQVLAIWAGVKFVEATKQ